MHAQYIFLLRLTNKDVFEWGGITSPFDIKQEKTKKYNVVSGLIALFVYLLPTNLFSIATAVFKKETICYQIPLPRSLYIRSAHSLLSKNFDAAFIKFHFSVNHQ